MNELATIEQSNIAIQLDMASQALAEVTTDFERIEIRDTAKAIQAASEILQRKDIQVQASLLVTDAERAIVKANPSRQGERTDKNFVTPKDDVISHSNLRNMRQAHTDISDSEYREIKRESVDSENPLTRDKLQKLAREKGKENRDRIYAKQLMIFPADRFSVIYADPPWRYESATPNRAIENHYPTMELQEIKDLGVQSICDDSCVLYLWATSAKAPEAFEVMTAWEFTYKSQFVWVKDKIGMGYWARGQHELLLVETKGKFSPPEPENRVSSVIHADRTEHSKLSLLRLWKC